MSADVNAKGNDPVNHPAHYTSGAMETWEAIEGLGLGFHAGNVLKYLCRYKLKGGIQDLHKARAYLNRLIDVEERAAMHQKLEAEAKEETNRNAAVEAGRQTGKNTLAVFEMWSRLANATVEELQKDFKVEIKFEPKKETSNEPVAIQSKRGGSMVKATNKGVGKRQRKGSVNRRK